jgi:hypothetical protein
MFLTAQRIGGKSAWLGGIGVSLCLFIMLGQHAAKLDSLAHGSAGVAGMQFAVADLDGDRKPDMASVVVENVRASSTSYAIRLQFGGGGDSYIGVKGPFGGLRLAIRDVNGDDSLDLVVMSVAERRVVQVLLNDGHGKFSVAEAGSYASVESDIEFAFREREPGPTDQMVLAEARTSFDTDVVRRYASLSHDVEFALEVRNKSAASFRESGSAPGRSPPVIVTVS